MLFELLDGQGQKRSALYHAARLEALHRRVLRRFDKVDRMANQVEEAAAVLVEAAHQPVPDARA
ncbi:hypothetical protein [Mesorhizobium sophorae]|uniref:hypothetical protein n=1 Tax=Mesorhizobium sophorae TaxID=1300294 RepID=UPI000BA474B3|nr:hypothetical protein [Mesorhizobium sophorae]